jgi:outer membrane protein assembly factor BamA
MHRTSELLFRVVTLLLASCLSVIAQAEQKGSDQHKILVDSLVVSGTRAVDSAELAEITNSIAGSVFSDDTEELSDRIRNQFQDHGYYTAEVQQLEVKVIDPLVSPKPVRLEAQVNEGMLCRLSSIDFTGNHALTSQELRALFPIKTGDVARRSKLTGGAMSLSTLLGTRGFLDFTFVIGDHLDSASTVKLDIDVQEGPQFRMDKLEISGSPEVAGTLQANWALAPGAIFDRTYVRKFLEENSSLLPSGFTESSGVEVLKNCSDSTVSVHLHLTQDRAAPDPPKHVDCAAEKKKKAE